ncbi:MAG TPA: hypothetical protein VHA52_10455 [Candidatus Babeliaceae bacterium]|nr:hypothetical protein [Candidatus Babeliaceae bacterium]
MREKIIALSVSIFGWLAISLAIGSLVSHRDEDARRKLTELRQQGLSPDPDLLETLKSDSLLMIRNPNW